MLKKEIKSILKKEIKKELIKQGLAPDINYDEAATQLSALLNKSKMTETIEKKMWEIMNKNLYIESIDGFDKELMGIDIAIKELLQLWSS